MEIPEVSETKEKMLMNTGNESRGQQAGLSSKWCKPLLSQYVIGDWEYQTGMTAWHYCLFRSGEFANPWGTVISWSLNQVWVLLDVWAGLNVCYMKEISVSIKPDTRRKHQGALNFPGRWLHWLDFVQLSGSTPAIDMAPQIFTNWKLHTRLQATWIVIVPLHSCSILSSWCLN